MAEENFRASIILDISQAVSAYTALRQDHLSTVSALGAGEGALRQVGQGFVDTAEKMAGGILTAVGAAGEFERKLDFFGAVSNSTQAEYDAISKKALQLGADTIYSAGEIADSFVELAKSGVSAQDVLDGIGEAVANLGAATDIPLAEAATSLTTILNTFKISAEDSVEVVDRLAGAANSSSIDVGDLITTMTYAGASAATAGVEFDDVNTAIALLGERGIKGSKAGTGLRQMFDKLIAPTNKSKEALQGLGIVLEDGSNQLLDMNGNLKPIPQLLDILNGSLSGLTSAEKMDVLGNIFPITSLPTILNLLDGGSEAMARLNGEITKTTALDIAGQRLDNLSGDIEYLRGELETLSTNVGLQFQDFARGIVQGLENIVAWVNTLDPQIVGLAAGFVAVVAALAGVGGLLALWAAGFVQLYQTAFILKDLFTVLPAVITAVSTAMKQFTKSLLTNPVFLVIAAIAALAAGLTWFFTQTETGRGVWEQLMAAFQQAAAVAMPFIQNLIDIVGNALGQAFQALMPVLQQVGEFLAGALPTAVGFLVTVFQSILSAIAPIIPVIIGALASIMQYFAPLGATLATSIGQIAAAFAPVIQTIISELLPALVELGGAFMNLVVMVAPLVANLLTGLLPVLVQLITAVLPIVVQLIQAIVPIVAQLAGVFLQVATSLITLLVPILTQIITSILPVVMALFQAIVPIILAVVTAFLPLIQTIVEMLIPAIQMIIEVVTAVFTALAPIIEAALQVVINIINTLTALLKGDWEGVWNGILSILQSVWDLIIAVVTNTINAVVSVVSSVLNFLSNLWNTMWSNIVSFMTDAWNNIITGIVTAAANIASFFQNLPGQIMGWIGDIGSWLLDSGRSLIQGFIDGITGMIGAIGDAVGGVMDFVSGFFPHSPAKRGPFSGSGWRNLLNSGSAIITQVLDGMESQQGAITKQMDSLVGDIASFYDQVSAAADLEASINMAWVGVGSGVDPSVQQLAQLNKQFDIMVGNSQGDTVALIPDEQLDTLANKIVQGFHSVRNADSEEAVLDVIRGTR